MSFVSARELITKVDSQIRAITDCPKCRKSDVCRNRAPLCGCFRDYFDESLDDEAYECPKFRLGHICKYFLTHKHDVSELLLSCDSLIVNHLDSPESLSCSAIGGGPGADYVGVLEWAFLSKISDRLKNLKYNNCEYERWAEEFRLVREYYEPAFRKVCPEIDLDVQLIKKPVEAELVTISYVLNEWRKEGCPADKAARMLLKYLTPTSVILLNDYNDGKGMNQKYFVEIEKHIKASASVQRARFQIVENSYCDDKFPDELCEDYKPAFKSRSLQMLLMVSR